MIKLALYLTVNPNLNLLGNVGKFLYSINKNYSLQFTTDKNGKFDLSNLKVTKGLAGTIYFVVSNVIDYGNSNTVSNCISNMIEYDKI